MRRLHFAVIATAVLAILPAPAALAKSGYQNDFRTAYPAAAGSRIDNCQICHANPDPGSNSARNGYGTAWRTAGKSFAAIETEDSDGDGFSNLSEVNALSYPGNASDKPAAASLTVTIEPVEARNLGAQWRVGPDGTYMGSGATVSGLPAGSQTVRFSAVAGWTAPEDMLVTIVAGQTTTATGTYVEGGTTVPNLVGMTQEAAQAAITGAGLAVGAITLEYSATVPTGTVISQDPAAGATVGSNSPIALTVSRGIQPPDDSGGGCNCSKWGLTPENMGKRLVDLFLAGLTLSILSVVGMRRR